MNISLAKQRIGRKRATLKWSTSWQLLGEVSSSFCIVTAGNNFGSSSFRLTLNETRQKFEAMKSARRKEVIQTLEKEMTPSFASFIAHFGYSNRVCAADVARGVAVRWDSVMCWILLTHMQSTLSILFVFRLESPRRVPLVERFENARGILRCFMKSHQDYGPLVKCFDLYKVSKGIVILISA